MAAVKVHEVGTTLCEALGLEPSKVHRLEIVAQGGSVVVTTVEYWPDLHQLKRCIRVLKAATWELERFTADE